MARWKNEDGVYRKRRPVDFKKDGRMLIVWALFTTVLSIIVLASLGVGA